MVGLEPSERWCPSSALIAQITGQLGRPPLGGFDVARETPAGEALVLHNAPFLWDGRPMPTTFWLLDSDVFREVGRLESAGGVRESQHEIDPEAIAAAHADARRLRAADVAEFTRRFPHVVPTGVHAGGVGGTRAGVKCLHAHVAHFLATGNDAVGRWTLERVGLLGVGAGGGVS